ncbi:MAG: fumarylacetoacetate hydrolase family protein [Alphaproteobacteria bacterium]|nr:fumarylacetoacetate hydrolase family protein [Alphaproteobacteria bacterium]MDX5369179.1 fumarylacetoacetate hydrolase family protein [Alphaproteobacteria bacterium]MDX5463875.1 fumarylacetoacetate hydrolase family protein [Alphaproteobacteria bacterium]
MKLVRYGEAGRERPGLLDAGGRVRDLSGVIDDVGGRWLLPAALEMLRGIDPATLPAVEGAPRLGAPVANVGKLVCIGLNYADHADEMNLPRPDKPVVFMKATSSICGPNDDILIPPGSEKTDWEVELGIVIGAPARFVAPGDALAHVAGYTLVQDVSERDWQQNEGGQWVKAKSSDTFGPVGPWLVTADEVPDPQALDIWLEVNGTRMQDGNTATMIFGVAEVVAHISRFMTLQPGDVIATGTPPGVGVGRTPQVFYKPGDTVRLGISGLGEQTARLVRDPR